MKANNLVLTVGNWMMGDDGAGPLLARLMEREPIDGWDVIEGDIAPENIIHKVRAAFPKRILVVDASDMDLAPGSVRLIKDQMLENPFLITTHSLPLTFLIEALRDFSPQVELLGIQPDVVAFGFPMSGAVRSAVYSIYEDIKQGNERWEALTPSENAYV